MYKLTDVKAVCEAIYGKKLKKRAWIYWKRKVLIQSHAREIDSNQLGRLITLANLKRKQPYKEFSIEYIIEQKETALKEFYAKKYIYQEYLLPDECNGSNLLGVINLTTGRDVSTKTLYRIGKRLNIPYSLNRIYKKNEMLAYISVFS